jgi:hypothetical protein
MATRRATSSRRASQRKAGTGRGKAAATSALAVPTADALSRQARKQEAQWRAESDLRTLREAEQIRADRARLRGATRMASAELKALEAITRRNKT